MTTTRATEATTKNKAWSRIVVVWSTPARDKEGKPSRRISTSLAVMPEAYGTTREMVGYTLKRLRRKYGPQVYVKDNYYEDGGSECFLSTY